MRAFMLRRVTPPVPSPVPAASRACAPAESRQLARRLRRPFRRAGSGLPQLRSPSAVAAARSPALVRLRRVVVLLTARAGGRGLARLERLPRLVCLLFGRAAAGLCGEVIHVSGSVVRPSRYSSGIAACWRAWMASGPLRRVRAAPRPGGSTVCGAADVVAAGASSRTAGGAVRAARIAFCRARLATRARSYRDDSRGGFPSAPAIHQRIGQAKSAV